MNPPVPPGPAQQPPPNYFIGSPEYQAHKDAEHIKLLSIFHYVYAGLVAVATLWPLIYVGMGLMMVSLPLTPSTPPPVLVPSSSSGPGGTTSSGAPPATPTAPSTIPSTPSTPAPPVVFGTPSAGTSGAVEAKMFGWLFFGIGVAMSVAFLVVAILNFLAARWLSARRNRLFILILSGVNTMAFPIGTGLGVFTFIVLLRPSVEALFEGERQAIGVDQ